MGEETEKQNKNPVAFAGSVLKYSVSTWSGSLISALAIVLGTRFLTGETYGIYNIYINTANTLTFIAALGLDHAYIRFYPEPPDGISGRRNLAAVCFSASAASLLAFSLAILLLFPSAAGNMVFSGDRRLLLAMTCLSSFCLLAVRFFNITYRMQDNIKMYTVQYVLQQFFMRLFVLLGVPFGRTADFLIPFAAAGLAVFAAVFFFLQRDSMLPKKITAERRGMKPLFRYGLGLAPTNIFNYGNSLFGQLYINAALGAAAAGIYIAVSQAGMLLGILQAGFSVYWSAFIFKNHGDARRRIARMHEYMMLGIMLLMSLLIASSPLLFLLLGAEFRAGRGIFGLVMFAPMLLIISETTVYGISIAKKTYFDAAGMGISFVLNVLLAVFFIPRYGIAGAGAALAVSGTAMFLFRTAVAQRFYRTVERPAKTAVALLLMAALTVFAFLFDSSVLLVSAAGAALAVFYLLFYGKEAKRLLLLAREILCSIKKSPQAGNTE